MPIWAQLFKTNNVVSERGIKFQMYMYFMYI